MTDLLNVRLNRRAVLQSAAVGALGVDPALRAAVYAAGSDAPEKTEVKIGFIPLTDCASIVMASVLGLDQKYGVKIVPSKESSWASIRDKVMSGENDFTIVGGWAVVTTAASACTMATRSPLVSTALSTLAWVGDETHGPFTVKVTSTVAVALAASGPRLPHNNEPPLPVIAGLDDLNSMQ